MADNQAHLATPTARPGISPEGWLTDSWYLGAVSTALKPGQQFRRIILNEPVVLGRTQAGEAFALRDVCPHRLVPLSAGRQIQTDGAATLECPYHGWRFGTDGVCRRMPSLIVDEPYDPARVRVRRYPVHEANGMVHVYVAHAPRADAPPRRAPPDFGPLPATPKLVIERTFNGRMDDAVLGLMDPAHLPFMPTQRGGRSPSTGLKRKEAPLEARPCGWAIGRHPPCYTSGLYRAVFGDGAAAEIEFQLPGFRWARLSNAGARLLSLTCLTPETESQTRMTQLTWWTGAPLLNLAIPFAIKGGTFPDQDGRAELETHAIDVQAEGYQRMKQEWAEAAAHDRAFVNPIRPTTLRWHG